MPGSRTAAMISPTMIVGIATRTSTSRCTSPATSPPSVAGEQPGRRPQHRAGGQGDERQPHRDPCAADEPGEHVAPEVVGTQRMGERRCREAVREIGGHRVQREQYRDHRRGQRQRQECPLHALHRRSRDRIECQLQRLGGHAGQHRNHHHGEQPGLEHRQVLADHGVVEQPPEPRHREHHLDDDGAAEQAREEHPRERRHGGERQSRAVAPQHDAVGQPFRTRQHDVLAGQHVGRLGPGELGGQRRGERGERERGEHDVRRAAPPQRREQGHRDREQQHENRSEDEVRHRDPQHRRPRHDTVHEPARSCGRRARLPGSRSPRRAPAPGP